MPDAGLLRWPEPSHGRRLRASRLVRVAKDDGSVVTVEAEADRLGEKQLHAVAIVMAVAQSEVLGGCLLYTSPSPRD